MREVPFPFLGIQLGAVTLGLLAAWFSNGRWGRDESLRIAVRDYGGGLRILLHEANRTNRSVMLTLNNRKVYLGWVFVPPPLSGPSHVTIFPTLSGFRSSERLSVEWTTNYSPAYEDIIERKMRGDVVPTDLEHFQLVIPLEAVTSATYFDIDLYHQHFAPRNEAS